jgi:hypothetical protein
MQAALRNTPAVKHSWMAWLWSLPHKTLQRCIHGVDRKLMCCNGLLLHIAWGWMWYNTGVTHIFPPTSTNNQPQPPPDITPGSQHCKRNYVTSACDT